ncbi:MAG: DUF4358 domain-containing protein [Oscillospiraceae bacterium]|jgi:hypothetical protein|nr:DUF4358 domain-containing protein [Oscillospiraceae bacterium]
MKKNALVLISAIVALSLLAGCGGSAKVRDDVDVGELSAALAANIGGDGLAPVSDGYYAGAMKIDVTDFAGYDVKVNANNADEIGVFKAGDAAGVADVKQAVETYIQMRKDTWMTEYMPEHRPKLDAAEIKTLGNYVMYAILSDDAREAVFSAIEKQLTA